MGAHGLFCRVQSANRSVEKANRRARKICIAAGTQAPAEKKVKQEEEFPWHSPLMEPFGRCEMSTCMVQYPSMWASNPAQL
jgi:hypothetical protein